MFDYDDSINLAFDAKIAGKKLVTAKHELFTKTGEFLFLAHSDRELALRMQMVEEDIEKVAHRKLSNVSDSKAKLVRAIFDEWQLRHASCSMCKTAAEHDHGDMEFQGTTPRVTRFTEKGNVSVVNVPCTIKGCTNHVYRYPGMPEGREGKCYPHGGVSAEGYAKEHDDLSAEGLPPKMQSKTAAGEWSSMGRWNGENTVCSGGGKDGVFNVFSCGAVNPPGGLGSNTGLCLNCEEKRGMKTPAHDYKGQTFNDSTTAPPAPPVDRSN